MRRVMFVAWAALVAAAGCRNDSTVVVGAPDAPRAVEASYYAGAITVRWELGPAWDGESFRVYGKRASDADFFFIADVTSCTSGVCTYTDTNIEANVTYEYYVAAWDAGSDLETASASTVQVVSPARTPPPIPNQTAVIALDNATYIVWGARSRDANDFSFYRVYQAASDGSDYLLGETDSEGFIDLLAANGFTYEYFVTAVDVDGHESAGSQIAAGTPRPDYSGEVLYDYNDIPGESGFRFQEDELSAPILHGDDPDAHFSVERDGSGEWWLVPGAEALGVTDGYETTALRCGPASDSGCTELTMAPTQLSLYSLDPVLLVPGRTYAFRVYGDDGEVHYAAIRVVGTDPGNLPGVIIFDWAYQLQPGNPALAPAGS